jgi:cytosine/creatinine deaminase
MGQDQGRAHNLDDIPQGGDYRIVNARIPLCLLAASGVGGDSQGLAHVDILIERGKIGSIAPAGGMTLDAGLTAIDARGAIVLPRLVDIHTHLDKGFIWNRAPNPDGTFLGALTAVERDREANWSSEDLARRMDFGLRCALAHGTAAIRTHLDSLGKQTAISWPVFAEIRQNWDGIIALQATSLFSIDTVLDNEEEFREIVATTARYEGNLGCVTFTGAAPGERTDAALDRVFQAAIREGLDLDFHVDESDLPEARTLERVADAAIRNRFPNKLLCGHCCSASLLDDVDLSRLTEKVAQARIAVVSLPMCNMYLQDRESGRTPRWRGTAPLHEFKAAGIPVMVASDNTRDPFYAYGDLDLLEVYREAARILHFDHGDKDWLRTIAATPADMMNLDRHGRVEAGDPADLVITRARSMNELLSRPQNDRIVIVAGRPIDTTPPDYAELDALASHRIS